uniref:Ribonuclease II/R domain-containing protein n=1 Tax=Plectus sambesii TaxID=2011161 RepID=A0A914WIJ6_9BILA
SLPPLPPFPFLPPGMPSLAPFLGPPGARPPLPDPVMMSLALSSMFHMQQQQQQRLNRPRAPALDAEATALLASLQRGRPSADAEAVRTGKISVAELMGKQQSSKTQTTPKRPPTNVPPAQQQQHYFPPPLQGLFAGPSISSAQSQLRQPPGANKGQQQQQQLKARKPFFTPYLTPDALQRGLKNGSLVKGALRVNQRNYEESFVDNPEGNEQQDIVILGLHDRNRALHGDVVVVRIKERIHWIVRDNMYRSWREGHLNISRDDDGQPLTIPPIKQDSPCTSGAESENGSPSKPVDEKSSVSALIPSASEDESASLPSAELPTPKKSSTMDIPADLHYERSLLLRIYNDLNATGGASPAALDSETATMIRRLSIHREDGGKASPPAAIEEGAAGRSPPGALIPAVKKINQGARRGNYKLLSEMPDEDWGIPDACLQKTAEVVFIAEQKNSRAAVGQLKTMADNNRSWALFSPGDSRMPRMMIPSDQLPTGFFDRPQDFAKFIFIARMVEWQPTAQFARGKLYRSLGMAGEIEPETEGLLIANDIDTREFSAAAIACLPVIESSSAWTIPEPNNELDNWAANRATSVYLIHKVIPMLPRLLCEELCSLVPGVDRLTFSVVWKLNDRAEIVDEWFGRSIIKSCVKLAYEHAQGFIADPDREWTTEELPVLSDGRTPAEIATAVRQLNQLAAIIRKRRFDNGAVRLDQPKLVFTLDAETGMPSGCTFYERKDANSLVEEYMLMANAAVAKRIEEHYPKTALLRRHPPPNQKLMREVIDLCEKIGYPVDGRSSGGLHTSLQHYIGDTSKQTAVMAVLTQLLMRPMKLAVYFCTGTVASQADYRHYALNMPFYTHFTSPIRRYADVMVHRLLAASLGYCPPPTLTPEEVEMRAKHCNDKKYAAKQVSEASGEMFFGVFIKACGPIEERGVVMNVLDQSFDVLLVRYGIVKRVYANKLQLVRDPKFEEGPPPVLTLYWDPAADKNRTDDEKANSASSGFIKQTITICSIVTCVLTSLPEPTKFQAVIKPCADERAERL